MIALFCEDEELAADVRRLIADVPLRCTECRDAFHAVLRSSHSGLVVLPEVGDADGRA